MSAERGLGAVSAERGRPPQRPAGVVTRLMAAGIDVLVVLAMMLGLYLGVAGLRFLWSPSGFQWPASSLMRSIVVASVLAFLYLTVAWSTTGRSYGAAVLGLRVLSGERVLLGWFRSAVRAAACVVFPAGLLWVAVSRDRRSVQDVFLRSVVVYDWLHHRGPDSHPDVPGRPAR